MKEKLFQIFFCFFIVWEQTLSAYLSFTGGTMDGMMMRLTLLGIAGISWMFYLLFQGRCQKEFLMLFILFLFGLSFYYTRHFYVLIPKDIFKLYNGQFLRWGADCISACLIGMTLTKLKSFDYIHKFLPILCIAITPFMAIATLTMGRYEGQLHTDVGANYQTIAYSMAVLFCVSFFYCFIYKSTKSKSNIRRMVMMAAMLIQSVCCAMAGGRGGLVLLFVYIMYMCYFMIKNRVVSLNQLLLIIVASFFCFMIVAGYLGLWESSGYSRSSKGIHDDDRLELWSGYIKYITESPIIGHGIGGDYFTLGFYSHNVFVDWMVETGIIGTLFLSYLFFRIYKSLFSLAILNQIFIVIMIFFIYGVIHNMFSGYWITSNTHWLVFGILMSKSNYFRKHGYNVVHV